MSEVNGGSPRARVWVTMYTRKRDRYRSRARPKKKEKKRSRATHDGRVAAAGRRGVDVADRFGR